MRFGRRAFVVICHHSLGESVARGKKILFRIAVIRP
jgi:hypothetical protein